MKGIEYNGSLIIFRDDKEIIVPTKLKQYDMVFVADNFSDEYLLKKARPFLKKGGTIFLLGE